MSHLLNADEVSLLNMFRDVRKSYSEDELCFDNHYMKMLLEIMLERGYVTKDEEGRYSISEAFREDVRNRLQLSRNFTEASESAANLSNL